MISIVIPTFNEEAALETTLESISRIGGEAAHEVVVCDGGSSDRTVHIAGRHAHVIQTPKGRARQLNAGVRCTRGDILFFVHADMRLPRGALRSIVRRIDDGGYDGGGFSNVFSGYNRRIKLLGRILNLRFVDNDRPENTIFFGDNGIFVRRAVFHALGGFKPLPIMEDYDFSVRMRERFRVVRISDPKLIVSPRRHVRTGFLKTRLLWMLIKQLYRLGVSPAVLARWYGDVR